MNNSEEIMMAALRGMRFLHDIEEQYLQALAPLAELREFRAGTVLFREGQSHPNIYLVIAGSVALDFRFSGRVLQTVGPGELLGWTPILGGVEMTATARVLEPTQAVAIRASQLIALCEHNPRFGFEFMRQTARALSRRLNATKLQLLDVYSHNQPTTPAVGENEHPIARAVEEG
jgi:CRP/FNR family transcriptional regulator, cyclic AMP receptor protein